MNLLVYTVTKANKQPVDKISRGVVIVFLALGIVAKMPEKGLNSHLCRYYSPAAQ